MIYPGDDSRFAKYSKKGISFGKKPHNTYQLKEVAGNDNETVIRINNESYRVATSITYFAINATIAVVVGKVLGFSENSIQKGLATKVDLGWRMKVQVSGDRKLVLDCYNANPVSMLAALEYWLQLEPKRPHIAILGDMLELGDHANSYHIQVGSYLKSHYIDNVIAVGEKARLYNGKSHYRDVDMLIESNILQSLDPKAIILLKASHGIHLERLIGRL
jgi:UDP-N-acetylmuramoyl-tripeptide--D-alanyl-D-alanine ligase